MKVTFETNADRRYCTFYSLAIGSIFTIDNDESGIIGIKTEYNTAFDLAHDKPINILSGIVVHKLDAELIIHERVQGTKVY